MKKILLAAILSFISSTNILAAKENTVNAIAQEIAYNRA
jgi:hypothetical protein